MLTGYLQGDYKTYGDKELFLFRQWQHDVFLLDTPYYDPNHSRGIPNEVDSYNHLYMFWQEWKPLQLMHTSHLL